jgi:hypothetical protein
MQRVSGCATLFSTVAGLPGCTAAATGPGPLSSNGLDSTSHRLIQ